MRSKSLGCLLLIGVALAGCAAPRAGKPVAKELSGSDPDAQLAFWHDLPDEAIASNDEAFHAVLLYADGQDDSADYATRLDVMKKRSMLPRNFNESAEAAAKRGTLAVAILRVLHERGGVTLHVFGPSPRYATRELMFLNVFPACTPNQAMSGNELVGIIGRVEDYQRGNPADYPASVLPGEVQSSPASTQAVRE